LVKPDRVNVVADVVSFDDALLGEPVVFQYILYEDAPLKAVQLSKIWVSPALAVNPVGESLMI
jgi:hypothetical protein